MPGISQPLLGMADSWPSPAFAADSPNPEQVHTCRWVLRPLLLTCEMVRITRPARLPGALCLPVSALRNIANILLHSLSTMLRETPIKICRFVDVKAFRPESTFPIESGSIRTLLVSSLTSDTYIKYIASNVFTDACAMNRSGRYSRKRSVSDIDVCLSGSRPAP